MSQLERSRDAMIDDRMWEQCLSATVRESQGRRAVCRSTDSEMQAGGRQEAAAQKRPLLSSAAEHAGEAGCKLPVCLCIALCLRSSRCVQLLCDERIIRRN